MPERRFPPPWDIEEANASCFIVKDNNGQILAYVYFESDAGHSNFFRTLLANLVHTNDNDAAPLDVRTDAAPQLHPLEVDRHHSSLTF